MPYRKLHRYAVSGGVLPVGINDSMSTIVDAADPVAPRCTDAFREYAQSDGFVVDPCRVAHPMDKHRVESELVTSRAVVKPNPGVDVGELEA